MLSGFELYPRWVLLFTTLNLLVFLGISFLLQCFINVARLSLALLKTQGCRDSLDSLAA